MNHTQINSTTSPHGYGLVVSEENSFIKEIDDRLFNTHLDFSEHKSFEHKNKSLSLADISSEEESDASNKMTTTATIRRCPKNNNNPSKKATKHAIETDGDSLDECPHKSVKKSSKSNNKKSTNHQDAEPEKKQKSLYKTELCRNWEETNHCRYGMKCQYAHGAADLRELDRHPKYKTQKCRTFHNTGSCPYGNRCTFRHFNLPGDALEMKNRDREEEEERQRQQQQQQQQEKRDEPVSIFSVENHKILAQNWFADNNVLPLAGLGAIPKRNFMINNSPTNFDPEDSLLPSNAESLLPHELLFDLESPEDEEKQPARCPLRNYVNLPSFSNFPVPHPQSHMSQQQQNCKTFFRPWLF
ncbi:hypothetical protein HPULCUR_000365 [Helicostylum pulchrum]|uniref:C3H1-type domain-containing protein n=1 Tax=Helicostylum pulchrum TaxID=562976 RepID=A0ABP9XJN4_9FUNG